MATLPVTPQNILNVIRQNSDDYWKNNIPEATKTNFVQVGQAITKDKNLMNSFISSLINKIAESHIKSKIFNNPLALLKGSGVPYGATIEEIFINPVVGTQFNNDPSLLLKQNRPDSKTAYYTMNRQSTFPITVDRAEVRQAFKSETDFMTFYNAKISALYSGDNIQEFHLMKNLFGRTIDAGGMQVINADISEPKELSKSITKMSKNFKYDNTAFCGYNLVNTFGESDKKCVTFCEPQDQCLIITSDAITEIGYEVLASMYNKDVAEITAMTIEVDAFPSNGFEIYAVLCDKSAVQVRDVEFCIEEQNIGSALKHNFWLHHFQHMYISMFANCVAFGKKKEAIPEATSEIEVSEIETPQK